MWGGNDKEWGEVWMKSGPMAGGPDQHKGPYHATYNDWGVWFAEEKQVRDSEHPGRTYIVDDGRLIDPEPQPVKPKKERTPERRTTAGGAPTSYDEILREKRQEYKKSHGGKLDEGADKDLRTKAKDEWNGQFKGKRRRSDDW
jgi:hypothetical protein